MTRPTLPRPTRRFYTDDLLAGRINLDAYPFRYIYVQPSRSAVMGAAFTFGAQIPDEIDKVLTAVEFLESRGWELVNLEQGGLLAHLRRRHHPTPAYRPAPASQPAPMQPQDRGYPPAPGAPARS